MVFIFYGGVLFLQLFIYSDQLFQNVNAIFHNEHDHYMILYGGDKHQASIYDADNDEKVRDVIRTGRGRVNHRA